MLKRIVSTNRAAVIGVMLAMTIAALMMHTSASGRGPEPRTSQPAAQGGQAPHDKQMVVVWVHGEDIYPSVVRVRPGKVKLRAENETLSDITLVVERVVPGQSRQTIGRVNTLGSAKRKDLELQLGAGEYVFYEETHPDVTGTVIVEPM
jgi:hypothetical protein